MGFFVNTLVPTDDAVSILEYGFDRSCGFADFDGATGFHFFAGADEAFPFSLAEFVGANEFDFPIVGKKAGWGDLGIVEDQEVIGFEIRWEISEHAVFDFSCVSVYNHHT